MVQLNNYIESLSTWNMLNLLYIVSILVRLLHDVGHLLATTPNIIINRYIVLMYLCHVPLLVRLFLVS